MPSEIASGQTTEGLPVAPSLGPALLEARVPPERALVDARVVFICALSIVIAAAAGVVAQALTRLIGFVTNLAFYGRVSSVFVSPAANRLGPLVILVPIAGAVVVGLMARYGSAAIRGHGIPEAMEQVLLNKSRIPARVTVLKPVSAAISIGTGGPFGAEGPIIATGGALGSLLRQLLHTTAVERKTLLAAGAAAGMTATFGSPVPAVPHAAEALLFLGGLKFISWSISLGSGTSGGTLAPLFTIGGALGGLLGEVVTRSFPHLGVDPRIAALVGMAAMFAGASRALLASVVFAFETTRQPIGLLPLLGGCTASFLLSCLMMRNTIMTEKIARRGVRVPGDYAAGFLDQVTVGLCASKPVVTLNADDLLEAVRGWIAGHGQGSSHQGFPVVDAAGDLVGVVTRRDLLDPERQGSARVRELIRRPVAVAFEDSSLREAADDMVQA